jgi:antitoxin VapB
MKTAKIFRIGKSQAVRIPKEFRLDGTEVYIKKIGRQLILMPKDDPWEPFFSSLHRFTPDFMAEREQPTAEKREGF